MNAVLIFFLILLGSTPSPCIFTITYHHYNNYLRRMYGRRYYSKKQTGGQTDGSLIRWDFIVDAFQGDARLIFLHHRGVNQGLCD